MAVRLTERIEPKKDLGQHFLVDRAICRRIVHFAGVSSDDIVLEVGPGTGQLTNELLATAAQVIVIEVDHKLIPLLRDRWDDATAERLRILEGDVLKVPLEDVLPRRGIRMVANLPYNIATPIIKKMTEVSDWFHSLTVMVQREVASRILAPCLDRRYGYFSLFAQFHYRLEKGFQVRPGAFSPRPAVTSTVVKMTPRGSDTGKVPWSDLDPIVSCAFRHPRKTLLNNLKFFSISGARLREALSACGIEPSRRPHQVSLKEFCCLVRML